MGIDKENVETTVKLTDGFRFGHNSRKESNRRLSIKKYWNTDEESTVD